MICEFIRGLIRGSLFMRAVISLVVTMVIVNAYSLTFKATVLSAVTFLGLIFVIPTITFYGLGDPDADRKRR